MNQTAQAGDSQPPGITLVADTWIDQGNGNFEDRFYGVLGNNSSIGPGEIKVYVVLSDEDFLISSGAIQFMGGELSASRAGSDLRVIYRKHFAGSGLPFEKMLLKVVK